jgi:6-phosphogluconate dehydrogenase (decarboxylating)
LVQGAAGEFLKMIHTGIAYGLMQAYAEEFNILRGAASQTLTFNRRWTDDIRVSPCTSVRPRHLRGGGRSD